ncbi:hypothetical protein FE697_009510 [Mumia zhuanghuii]|uniref:DUF6325 family protein n=2 Tax=Mumia TaxID=1546255 RepID=A0ABW1QPC0_9ACTN|nr:MULTISPECIES: DUF6325 family protein [Mumia]KAA1423790.1 hypothetical protein FE697_009510 [Mumia zhuanghuii]
MAESVGPSGPVDIAVLGFLEGYQPDGSVAKVVADAVASGAVRLLDAVIVARADDGDLTIIDVDDGEAVKDVLGIESDVPGLLGEEDILAIADEVPPGTAAVLVVWENVWAARFAAALDRVGGVVLAHERIDRADLDAVAAALSTD